MSGRSRIGAVAPIAAKSDVLVPINCGLPKFDPKLWLV
jgi:hypothetical protein